MSQLLPALIETIKSSRDTIVELADVAVEALDTSGLLNKVPIVSVATTTLEVRDAFARARLKRNCMAFMKAVAEADRQSLTSIVERLQTGEEFAEDFSDTLMVLLLEAQKPIKCAVVGRLVLALANQKISEEDFSTLAEIIHACTVPALKALPAFFEQSGKRPYSRGYQAPGEGLLLSLGIAYRFGNVFRIDDRGQTLFTHGFGGIVNETIETDAN
jgi:hypothetical protein